jgi:hypothetical protein
VTITHHDCTALPPGLLPSRRARQEGSSGPGPDHGHRRRHGDAESESETVSPAGRPGPDPGRTMMCALLGLKHPMNGSALHYILLVNLNLPGRVSKKA